MDSHQTRKAISSSNGAFPHVSGREKGTDEPPREDEMSPEARESFEAVWKKHRKTFERLAKL